MVLSLKLYRFVASKLTKAYNNSKVDSSVAYIKGLTLKFPWCNSFLKRFLCYFF